MNYANSPKLHKSHKIVCFIVCFVIVFATFAFTAFADDATSSPTETNTYLIKAGTYRWNDTLTILTGIGGVGEIAVDFNFSTSPTISIEGIDFGEWTGMVLSFSGAEGYTLSYDTPLGEALPVYAYVDANNENNNPYWNKLSQLSEGIFPDGYGQTITITSDIYVNQTFGSWFDINTNFIPNEYDGNPWVDILNGVLVALDVNIFGTFSYLDIVSTLAGACLAIWLLKMLAGG